MVNYIWENYFRKGHQAEDILTALKEIYLFEGLTRRELRLVKETAHARLFRPGEVVFRQEELGVGMYIILRGAIEILAEAPADDLSVEPVLVTRLTRGDFFGELSLIEKNSRRTASAVASEETLLLGFFKPDLLEIIERQPVTGVKIVHHLAEVLGRRLKETTLKVTELKRELARSETGKL